MTDHTPATQAAQQDWNAAVSAANLAPTTGSVILNAVTVLEIAALLSKQRAPVAHLGLPDVLPEFTSASGAQFVSMGTVGTVLRAARAALASAPVAPSEVMDALNWVDDFIARCNRDDRGSCESVNVLRRALASAPPAFDRHQLRALVDTVWNEATESTAVPDMPWADRMIDKVFSAAGASAPVADGRATFEAWAEDKGLIQKSHGIMSIDSQCDLAREAWQAGSAALASAPAAAAPFMYGIMDPKGEAYFAEYCVSGAKGDLAAEVEALNGFGTGGYQEVAMYLRAPDTPQATGAARNAALEEAAQLAEAFGQAAGRGDHFESSRYESVAPLVAKEIAKDIRARRSRQPEGQ